MFGIVLLTIVCVCVSLGQQQNGVQEGYKEFEDVYTRHYSELNYLMARDNASGGKTFRVVDPDGDRYTIMFNLCVWRIDNTKDAKVTINNIRYSNNGPSDTVTLRVRRRNGQIIQIGEFITTAGQSWNVFMNSGQIGETTYIGKGANWLKIQVKTDSSGIEFDKISVTIENQNITKRDEPICVTDFEDKKLEA